MSAQDPARVRRFWTPKEDEILISEAERLRTSPHHIATHHSIHVRERN